MLNHKSFGSGPPLVVLHGLFGTLDNWQTLARKWAELYTVILVDQRNHGRSPHFDRMDYNLMAEDLAEFLEAQWIHECFLLGHSMGGKVAMQTALNYPDLVEKLVVVDIAPRAYRRGHDDVFAALRSLNPATVGDRQTADTTMAQYLSDPGVRQFLLKNLARAKEGGFRWRMNLPVIHQDYEKIIGPLDLSAAPYEGPSLFIRGAKSGYVQDDDLPAIEANFPKAKLITVADAGHWVHAEQPDALRELVTTFLG
ncbi:alpha/beta fold hydrolase [Lewinella sp. W8]|uniref:alpha/beta fold hydrolase n=1 Tax=Lewinella sp. W8 TaxID=2528208 RepID=UPI001068BFA6|nr:alpha/beta fold hydrolase [Lewinella sp. W8]MTB53753.1 alpha/beta fold hydrolase [Lewinella sp. W8]